MSECNLDRLIGAGLVAQEFKEASAFIDAINDLPEEEVNNLIKIGEKVKNFKINAGSLIQPQWC